MRMPFKRSMMLLSSRSANSNLNRVKQTSSLSKSLRQLLVKLQISISQQQRPKAFRKRLTDQWVQAEKKKASLFFRQKISLRSPTEKTRVLQQRLTLKVETGHHPLQYKNNNLTWRQWWIWTASLAVFLAWRSNISSHRKYWALKMWSSSAR